MNRKISIMKLLQEGIADRFMYRLARALNKKKSKFGFEKGEKFVYDLHEDSIKISDGYGGTLFKGKIARKGKNKIQVIFNGRVFFPSSYESLVSFLEFSRRNNLFSYSEDQQGDSGGMDMGGGGMDIGGGGMDMGGGKIDIGGGGMDMGGGGMDTGGEEMESSAEESGEVETEPKT